MNISGINEAGEAIAVLPPIVQLITDPLEANPASCIEQDRTGRDVTVNAEASPITYGG